MNDATAPAARTSPIAILLAWAVVGIPLAWGVLRTIDNAAKLFQ